MNETLKFPFPLDGFQEEAIAHISRGESVLVSAPTGAGKTVIAEAAIHKARSEGNSIIYTAPIKALSNQKYRDFRETYKDDVGIVTGDVSINPDAAIVIMTTEIYRNSLFENSERIQKTGWVIFDEIHYLNDPERGTVWEEAILFTPPHIRMLALSATVPNIRELSEWMEQVHETPIHVVIETHRPVPLEFFFQCQGRFYAHKKRLLKNGYLDRSDWSRFSRSQSKSNYFRVKPNRLDPLLENLQAEKQLPCVYFAFGRKRTEKLAFDAMKFNFVRESERVAILELYDRLLERYQLTEEISAQDMRSLLEHGIGFHHAGMLPSLKEVIEQLFTSRLLKLIFTTETFALGINMPARCVVFDELQKFYGNGFRNLTTRDFYQMAGRAGRRGMDDKGDVYIRVNPHYIQYNEVIRIIEGAPEPIQSQFNAAYATVLNLFDKMGYKLLDIYPRSLHHFQSSKKIRREGRNLLQRKLALLRDMGYLSEEGLTDKGKFGASLFGFECLLTEMQSEGNLEKLDPVELCILVSSLVFEPRKDDALPRLPLHTRKMKEMAEHYYRALHRLEAQYRITPYTRPPHFNISGAVEAWARGTDFDALFRLAAVDEGEIVRNIRMIIQLLREIQHAPGASHQLIETARQAVKLINRDIVDAERQLRA